MLEFSSLVLPALSLYSHDYHFKEVI